MHKFKERLTLALRAGLGVACLVWGVGLTFWVFAWILIQGGNAQHSPLYLSIAGAGIVTGAIMSYAAGKKARRIEAQDAREAGGVPADRQMIGAP
jgi:hypothetical protein